MFPVPFAQIESWTQVVEFLSQKGIDLGLNLLAAVGILIIGRWAVKLLVGVSRRVMTRAKVDETLTVFLGNIAYAVLLTLVVIAAVDRLGVDTTSVAAAIAAAGLAVGLALQSSLSNLAAGVMLILFKPFGVGDYVEAGGAAGTVKDIHIFNTRFHTADNVMVTVPNGQITGGKITNYSANPTRRIDLTVGCGYGDDLRAVKEFLTTLLSLDERILKVPEPTVVVSDLADSSVNFAVRPWVASKDFWAVRCDLTERIKLGFDERGFSIPFPSRDVYLHGEPAVEGHRG